MCSTTPNLLFEHSEFSYILEVFSSIDPVNMRLEGVDELIIKLNTSEDLSQVFHQYIEFDKYDYLRNALLDESTIYEGLSTQKDHLAVKEKLIKLFIRFYSFKHRRELFSLSDQVYW